MPIVRAPTNRGELAQRAAGIVTRSLVPKRPAEPVLAVPQDQTPSIGPAGGPPPALGAPVGQPVAYPATPRPVWPPPETALAGPTAPPAPAPPAAGLPAAPAQAWSLVVPPPPPPAYGAGPPDPTLVPMPSPPVETTAVLPIGGRPGAVPAPRSYSPSDPTLVGDPARAEETKDKEEVRVRSVRPGVDASWPPPPGPWSGRRTTES